MFQFRLCLLSVSCFLQDLIGIDLLDAGWFGRCALSAWIEKLSFDLTLNERLNVVAISKFVTRELVPAVPDVSFSRSCP